MNHDPSPDLVQEVYGPSHVQTISSTGSIQAIFGFGPNPSLDWVISVHDPNLDLAVRGPWAVLVSQPWVLALTGQS